MESGLVPGRGHAGQLPSIPAVPVCVVGQDVGAPGFSPRKLATGSLQVGVQMLTTMDVVGPNR